MSQYNTLSEHDHYTRAGDTLLSTREGGGNFIIVSRSRSTWTTNYRCYRFASQAEALADATRRATPLLTCRVSRRGKQAVLMQRDGTRVGVVTTAHNGEEASFKVNGHHVLGMTIGRTSGGKSDIDTYEVHMTRATTDPPLALHMRRPTLRARDMTHRLRYHRIRTKKCGIASCKNFCLDQPARSAASASASQQEEGGSPVFECIKSRRHDMLVYFAAPLDGVLAAALAILRFER